MRKRVFAFLLCTLLFFACALPCLALGDSANEVKSDQADYLLYGVVILAVVAVVVFALVFFFKRRK